MHTEPLSYLTQNKRKKKKLRGLISERKIETRRAEGNSPKRRSLSNRVEKNDSAKAKPKKTQKGLGTDPIGKKEKESARGPLAGT